MTKRTLAHNSISMSPTVVTMSTRPLVGSVAMDPWEMKALSPLNTKC